MHSNKFTFPCCFVMFSRSATRRLNFNKENGDDVSAE